MAFIRGHFHNWYLNHESFKLAWKLLIGNCPGDIELTHWGRVTYICVSKLATIGSDNGLSPGRRQAIIWSNAGILLIEPQGTNFSEIVIVIQIFSFKKMHLKLSSAKWRPFCHGPNVLKNLSALMLLSNLSGCIHGWRSMTCHEVHILPVV